MPPWALCALTSIEEYGWGGVNSTTIQCVHEQSLTGICIFPEFNLLQMDHLCTHS